MFASEMHVNYERWRGDLQLLLILAILLIQWDLY